MKNRIRIAFILAVIAFLAACQAPAQTAAPAANDTAAPPASTFTPGPTLTPTFTPEPTETLPPTWTPTPAFTASPTAPTYVREGSTIPVPDEPITAENADQIVELARLGKGTIQEVQLSPNRVYLLVRTTIGIYGYRADTLEQVWAWEDPAGIATMAVPKLDRWIAAATNDGRIALLIYQRGSMFSQIISGYEYITGLAFSSDGDLLAAIGDQGVTIWQVGETEPLYEYPRIEGGEVRFTPDGDKLIAYYPGYANFYTINNGDEWKTIEETYFIEFSPDGTYFADYQAVFDGNSGEELFQHPWGSNIKFSPNSKYLVFSQGTDHFQIWNIWTEEKILELYSPYTGISATDGKVSKIAKSPDINEMGAFYFDFAFSPDSMKLAIATEIDAVEIWDLDSGKLEQHIPCNGENLIYRKNSRLVVYGEGGIKQLDPNSGITINQSFSFTSSRYYNNIFLYDRPFHQILFSPSGEWMFIENYVWQIPEGIRAYRLGNESIEAVSPNGEYIFTFDNATDTVRTRRIGDFSIVDEFKLGQSKNVEQGIGYNEFGYTIEAPIMSPNGNYFLGRIGGDAHPYYFWDLETGIEAEIISAYGFSGISDKTGKYVIIHSTGFTIYNTETHQEITDIDNGRYGEVTLSPDEQYLIFAGNANLEDNKVEKYKVNQDFSVEFIEEFPGADSISHSIDSQAISPNNNLYASAFIDTLYIQDFNTGEFLIQIPAHVDYIKYMAFSPDGKYLVTYSYDGTVRIWGIPPQ